MIVLTTNKTIQGNCLHNINLFGSKKKLEHAVLCMHAAANTYILDYSCIVYLVNNNGSGYETLTCIHVWLLECTQLCLLL